MQYIYTMNGVSKTVPPKRQIIKDISLSFFPGAKIGLLGLNGAGKSTVLKIMAGVDTDFNGEARAAPGIKIGYLAQEPQLNAAHTVREAVEVGVGDVLSAQAALDKVYEAYAEEGADFDKLAAEQQRLEAILASGDAHTLEHQLEVAADALRLPPWDAVIGKLSGGEKRRVALCQLLLQKPDMLLLDEPTNHLDAESARIEELQSVDYQKRNETNEIFIPPGERLGNSVIELKHVSKSFGDRLLIDDLSIIVPPGAIVGIIGPNGAGKSTLFKMITGQEKPDQGEIAMGPTVKLAYVDQSREKLAANHNVFQEVSGGADILNINGVEIQSRAYIGRFNFKGQDQQKLVGTLSGGERGRLHLAKTLLQGGNVLLLDEPSNDLDIETLRALEDALLEFPGNTFVISHDRWFLDRIATHILAFEGDSHVEFFQGNYREYEEDKRRRLGEEGAKPHRLRFKALK
ncbi:MAG: ATP-binding cassette domain-containing protein [Gammaproteobacteria bacterium]|nr:ATP-binding cassette domain-containing protein [Gammaproteobacteria bacterium]